MSKVNIEPFAEPAPHREDIEREPRELTLRSGLATAGAALAYFVTVGFLNAFGVFQSYYSTDILRDKSNFQISWLGSFATFCIFFAAPAAGILADKFGPKVPMLVGSIGTVLGIMMVSLSRTYWQFFLTQGLLLGLSMSFVAIPASGMVPRYFKKHRGLASGLSVGGSSLGGVIWPIVSEQLFLKDGISFGWSFRIIGFIMLPLLAIVLLTVRLPVKKPAPKAELESKLPAESVAEKGNKTEVKKKGNLAALRTQPFILFCTGLAIFSLGFFGPFFYIATYAVDLGMSQDLAFYLVTTVNAASFFGRVLPGIVADRWGKFNILTGSAFIGGVIAFCWTTARSTAAIFVWIAAYGFASGAMLSLQLACGTSLVHENSAGTAVGVSMGTMSLSQLVGPPIIGELSKRGYLAVSCFTGATLLMGSVFFLSARLSISRGLKDRV